MGGPNYKLVVKAWKQEVEVKSLPRKHQAIALVSEWKSLGLQDKKESAMLTYVCERLVVPW